MTLSTHSVMTQPIKPALSTANTQESNDSIVSNSTSTITSYEITAEPIPYKRKRIASGPNHEPNNSCIKPAEKRHKQDMHEPKQVTFQLQNNKEDATMKIHLCWFMIILSVLVLYITA